MTSPLPALRLGRTTPSPSPTGSRREPLAFVGAQRAEKDSNFPPTRSALPDMSNWKRPAHLHDTVARRMHESKLLQKQRFESPFKCDKLRQPDPLRCTPIPEGQQSMRDNVLDKPTLLAATVRSLPSNVSPVLQRKDFKALTVPEMVSVLHHVASLSNDRKRHASPAQRRERELRAAEPMESANYSRGQLAQFDDEVSEKLAFGQFLNNNKRKKLPIMVLRYFRHQLCEENKLVRALRSLPLKTIEHAMEELGPRTINAQQWIGLLIKLVGDNFSRLEAHALFSFFDTDVDGDVDQRELCNGFVLLRSRDGPLVSVLHRCKAFLQPNIKDTRLTFMSRFELVLVAEAITFASADHLTDGQKQQLQRDLEGMLTSFGTNKRGEFPFDDVRTCVLASEPIKSAISTFTVPREPELYASPLAAYFRGGECDEGEQPFRLMLSLRALDKNRSVSVVDDSSSDDSDHEQTSTFDPSMSVLNASVLKNRQQSQQEPRKSIAAAAPDQAEADAAPARVAYEPDEPEFYTLKGTLYRKAAGQPPQPFWQPGMPKDVKYSERWV